MKATLVALIALLAAPAYAQLEPGTVVQDIYWSDGDSGRLDGIKFRIKGYDAPERKMFHSKQSGIIMRNGAQCVAEEIKGHASHVRAKTFYDNSKTIVVTANYGQDRYDRWLVDLSFNGFDYGTEEGRIGVLKPWDYDSGEPKPIWCAE